MTVRERPASASGRRAGATETQLRASAATAGSRVRTGPGYAATGLASAILWRRRGAGSARPGFMRKALSVILAVTATLLLTVVAYSAYSAADPGGALLALLGEG
jgi:hypothetical protein